MLHVIPPVKFGGGESILHALVAVGRANGEDERICCLYQSAEFERVLTGSQIPWYRLSEIDLGSGPSRTRSKINSFSLIFKLPKMLKIVRDAKPDVVHLHGFPSNLMGAVLAAWCRCSGKNSIPMVYTHHWVSAPKGLIERYIFENIFSRMNYVTAVSEASLRSLLRDHPSLGGRSTVVNNFASSDFFVVGSRRRPCKQSELVTFINVARFAPFKNQLAIVEAVGQLSLSERTQVKMIFVGDGETLPMIKARVTALCLDSCFTFKGFIPHAEVAQLLGQADVMMFPSLNEGSPIAIAEALAAGLPVLGLKQCAPVVEVAAEAGVFVEEAGLADGIRKCLQCDLAKLSAKARLRAQAFDSAAIKQRYLEIYRQVVEAN